MEQNHWPNHRRPAVISGAEPRRTRTGVAFSGQQSAASVPESRIGPELLPTDATGLLPGAAPLANPYVPFQRADTAQYPLPRALARGTLFPGLDLPLSGMVNPDRGSSPLNNLMALDFALNELGLYLDTHPTDAAALTQYRSYAQQAEQTRQSYEAANGPLQQCAAGTGGAWNWIDRPWPWELEG